MSTRYCSSCATFQDPTIGENVKNRHGKVVRWRCYACKIRALLRKDELDSYKPEQSGDIKNTDK